MRPLSGKYKTMMSLPKYGTLTYTQIWSKMQILEGYAEFESRVFAYIARRYNSAADSTSLLISVASFAISR